MPKPKKSRLTTSTPKPRFGWREATFLLLALIIFTINIVQLKKDLSKRFLARQINPYGFLGQKFADFKPFLMNQPIVGYYTDKDSDDLTVAAEFDQAQFVLAPIILDQNSLNHPFVILNCASESKAIQKIAELKMSPVKKNRFGIILARQK